MRCILLLLILLSLLLFPGHTADAARQALSVWGLSVVPSLFPYMVFCRLLSARLAASSICAAPVILVLGLLGGSPSGAAVLSSYGNRISPRLLRTLCAMTGTVSPMFTLGTLLSWGQSPGLCRLLLLCQGLGALLCGGLVFLSGKKAAALPAVSVPAAAVNPLAQSIDAILQVGGCIICFSVLASLLRLLPFLGPTLCAVLHSLLELSGGVHALCSLPLGEAARAVLIASLCGFSSLSILTQNHAFVARLGMRMADLFLLGLLRGGLAGLLAALLYPVFMA